MFLINVSKKIFQIENFHHKYTLQTQKYDTLEIIIKMGNAF